MLESVPVGLRTVPYTGYGHMLMGEIRHENGCHPYRKEKDQCPDGTVRVKIWVGTV
jgi:hypothetical protein